MQPTRKIGDQKSKRETLKDELPTKKPDEKLKKGVYSVSTPRNFVPKSTTADIYAKNAQTKAPKKTQAINKNSNVSPMKDFLKSSPSSVSTRSFRTKNEPKTSSSDRSLVKDTKTVIKKIPFNVTVNSPITKRKNTEVSTRNKKDKPNKYNEGGGGNSHKVISKDIENSKKERGTDISKEKIKVDISKNLPGRQRTKTRTLEDDEIKVLTPDVVENNAELLNLTKKLKAQPKAFFIDLDEDKVKVKPKQEKSSDEEVSYEDDFESYESDFESYHSEAKSDETLNNDDVNHDEDNADNDALETTDIQAENEEDVNLKEEKMLDSGNFELRDPRSASKSKPMDFITEVSEEGEKVVVGDEGKTASLVDEGFQDMSSGLSSMKTLHVDILEKPLFIDFTKSKDNRRKKRIYERLKQRAQDILSMVTLHEMSYNLFEMAPIPYDLYMATFGRFNYKQTAVQTYDDGITQEVQTEEVVYSNKWTQNPVEFSKNDIYLNTDHDKVDRNKELEQFKFFRDKITNKHSEISDNYRNDPLRIYLEQKDGVGSDYMLPKEDYDLKLKKYGYVVTKLRKFLKKVESRVSNILSINSGNIDMSNLVKTSKLTFSNGYVSITNKTLDENTSFLKGSIIGAVFSETKNNLIITIHNKNKSSVAVHKCVLCLWDYSMAKREPIKILVATDNVRIGRFRGNTDGYFVGALEDGSIHLWDLSEEPTWCHDVAIDEKITNLVEFDSNQTKNLTQTEKDREWNKKNSNVDLQNQVLFTLQASAYTSMAINVCSNEVVDSVVGLEFLGDYSSANMENGRKIIRQICSLQRTGILTIWSIIQEKTKNISTDIGKAFWSKMNLEKNQTINLTQHFELPIHDTEMNSYFNLNSAKKRLLSKRQEKNLINRLSRQNSSKSDIDRPKSVASGKSRSLVENFNFWDHIVCYHLKIMNFNNAEHYLVAKNYGEVLSCRKVLGNLKIKKLCVANSASSITCLDISPNNLPYFLAATDCGTVNLCSLIDFRVLLTLDCRNIPTSIVDKYQTDEKGRFLGTVPAKQNAQSNLDFTSRITCLSYTHPLRIIAISGNTALTWELARSDSRVHSTCPAEACFTSGLAMALLTSEEVQVYKMAEEKEQLELFNKYVALL